MSKSFDGFKKPERTVNNNGEYVLKLNKINKFPTVSIVTPTF